MLVCVGVYLLFVHAYDSRCIYIIIVGILTAVSRTEFDRSLRGRNKELWYAQLCCCYSFVEL